MGTTAIVRLHNSSHITTYKYLNSLICSVDMAAIIVESTLALIRIQKPQIDRKILEIISTAVFFSRYPTLRT